MDPNQQEEGSSQEKPDYRFLARGIDNRTGTCALNVAMQCLLAMDSMRGWFTRSLDSSPWNDARTQEYITETGMPMTQLVRKAFAQRFGTTSSHETFAWLESENASDALEGIKNFLVTYCPTEYRDGYVAITRILSYLSLEELCGPMFLRRGRSGLDMYFWSMKQSSGKMFRDCDCDWQRYFPSLKESLDRLVFDCGIRARGLETSTFFETEFESIYRTTVTCAICSHQTYYADQLWGLDLRILDYQALVGILKSQGIDCCKKKRFIAVDDILTFFPPPFCDKSMKCRSCRRLIIENYNDDVVLNAQTNFTIVKVPHTFIITVNLYEGNNLRNDRINFTEKLDLTKYVDPSRNDVVGGFKYKLVAMANRIYTDSGNPEKCHTVAFIRGSKYLRDSRYDHHASDVWFKIDDSYISRTNLSSVLNVQYIRVLVYEQCSDDEAESSNVCRTSIKDSLWEFLHRLRSWRPLFSAVTNFVEN